MPAARTTIADVALRQSSRFLIYGWRFDSVRRHQRFCPKKASMFRQFSLRSDDHRTTCWLAYDKRLKPGVLITLKNHPEPDRHWEIVRVGEAVMLTPPRQLWRVGGLL